MKELIKIQAEINAPKNQYNKFGKYNYRSIEDILEASKPILKKYNCYIMFSDEIVVLGERYYCRSTATIKNEAGETESVTAQVREAESRKGMDEAQISGATSSYARKYAAGGLLGLDDNKDFDNINKHEKDEKIQNVEDEVIIIKKEVFNEFKKRYIKIDGKNEPVDTIEKINLWIDQNLKDWKDVDLKNCTVDQYETLLTQLK